MEKRERQAKTVCKRLLFGLDDRISEDSDDDIYDDVTSGDDEDENMDAHIGSQSEIEDNVLDRSALHSLSSDGSDDDEAIDSHGICGGNGQTPASNAEAVIPMQQLRAPSGKLWSIDNVRAAAGRAPQRNVFREQHGPKRGVHPQTELESFLMYMDDVIDYAVRYTNLEGKRVIVIWNRNNRNRKHFNPITRDEMCAFIGLQILAGVFKSHYRDTLELWSTKDGFPVFVATMSRKRFLQIKRFFRVDDRQRRDPENPISPVLDVWSILVSKLKEYYTPGAQLTLDEQLLEYHGNVRFRQYISSKPGKFGIKIFWLTDAETSYPLNGIVYVGKNTLSEDDKRNSSSIPEALTMKIIKPWVNSGRGLTVDNWFTSIPLAERLLQLNTTLVGTIRSNRRDVPPAARDVSHRQIKSAKYFYNESNVLLSYWDKGSKPVLLVSTQVTRGINNPSGKPEILDIYKDTKSGVDNMDHLDCIHVSVSADVGLMGL